MIACMWFIFASSAAAYAMWVQDRTMVVPTMQTSAMPCKKMQRILIASRD
jgi:hypothetical protein